MLGNDNEVMGGPRPLWAWRVTTFCLLVQDMVGICSQLVDGRKT